MTGPVHTKVAAPTPQHASRQRPMSKRGDASEREADRAADVVGRGGSVSGWSFSNVPASNGASSGASVQREPIDTPLTPTPKDEKDKYIAGGLAALDTPAGKVLKEKVLSLPVVKPVVDALSSPTGKKAILGAAAAGIGGLAAAGKELPVQLPAFNLDKLAKGLEGKVIVRGPLNAPTTFGIVLSYTAPESTPKRSPKDQSTIVQRCPTGSATNACARNGRSIRNARAEDQQAEDEIIRMVVQRAGFPGVVIPIESSKPAEAGPTTDKPAPAEEKKKPDEAAPVQREPATTVSPQHDAPTADVDDGLGGGRALDPTSRRFMRRGSASTSRPCGSTTMPAPRRRQDGSTPRRSPPGPTWCSARAGSTPTRRWAGTCWPTNWPTSCSSLGPRRAGPPGNVAVPNPRASSTGPGGRRHDQRDPFSRSVADLERSRPPAASDVAAR